MIICIIQYNSQICNNVSGRMPNGALGLSQPYLFAGRG